MMNGGKTLAQECLVLLKSNSAIEGALMKQQHGMALQLVFKACKGLTEVGG